MSKKSVRALALGFFLSSTLVASFLYFDDSDTLSHDQEIEELEEEISYLEDELAQLEVAQANAELEQNEEELEDLENLEDDEESADQESDDENDDDDDDDESNDEAEEDDSDEDQEYDSDEDDSEEEEDVIEAIVTVGEGEPSSVVAQQLQEEGIIEDRFDFDDFLEENDYANLVRPGSYEVTNEMDYDQLSEALMGE